MNKPILYEVEDDIHNELLKEFWMYCHWQERFEMFGYKGSAVNARNSLRRIRDLSHARYKQIQAKKYKIYGDQKDNPESDQDDI